MQLCKVGWTRPGETFIDHTAYLEALPGLVPQLPPGAAAFATDPRHYDFYSEYCVKDLKVERIQIVDASAQLTVAIDFAFNDKAGAPRLSIVYHGVTGFAVTTSAEYGVEPDWITERTKRLGDLQLDEIMPAPVGCTHEIAMINGSLMVTCADLVATWS